MTRFRLERRERTPVLVQLLVPVAAVLVALVLCSGLVRLAGTGILHAYGLLFLSTFQTAYDIEDTLIKAAPLLLTGLAVAVAASGQLVLSNRPSSRSGMKRLREA